MRRRSKRSAAAALASLLILFALPTDAFGASDLSVQSVASPVGSYQLGQPIPIEFTVLNSGADPTVKGEAIVSIFRLLGGGEKTQVYSNVSDVDLANGASVTITPPSFSPTVAGTYEIEIFLFASNDGNFDNNLRNETFVVEDAPEPCTEQRPDRTTLRVDGSGGERTVANFDAHGITASERLAIDLAAGQNCCWNITAASVVIQGNGSLDLTGSPNQQALPTGPARYSLALSDPASLTELTAFRIDLSWSRCDSPQVAGNESITLIFLPDAEKAEEGTMTTGETPEAGINGDPVNTATGELFLPWRTDMALGAGSSLPFRRYYGSNLVGLFAPTDELGRGFSHNYAWRVERYDSIALVISPGGRTTRFDRSRQGWTPQGSSATTARLLEGPDGWRFADTRHGLVRHFDADGNLTSIVDRNGRTRTIERQNGELSAIADDEGRRLELTRENGRITGVSDGSRTIGYRYDGDLLTSISDPTGASDSLEYDGEGRLTAIRRPNGNRQFTQSYDANGRVATQTDAFGAEWSYAWNGAQTTITDPDGGVEIHEHSPTRRFVRRTDRSGRSTSMLYDGAGRRVGVVDRLGDTTRIEYDPESGRIARMIAADGATTTYSWNRTEVDGIPRFDLVRIDYPDGTSTTARYDGTGNLIEQTDRLGQTRFYTYDEKGRITTAGTEGRDTLSWFYDNRSRIDSILSSNGTSVAWKYDAFDRVIEHRKVDGGLLRYSWDDRNLLVGFRDAADGAYAFEYDANGNRTVIVDRTGGRWQIGYDDLDRVVSITDPEGVTSRRLFSARGRHIGLVDGNGDTLRIERDADDRIVAIVDAAGNRRSWELDAEGVVAATTDPRGSRTTHVTDELGRILSATDPLGLTTRYRYDELGRIVESIDPLGRSRTVDRDDAGRPVAQSLPGDITAAYGYDRTGRLSETTDPNGRIWRSIRNNTGRIVADIDPLGNRVDYDLDESGLLAGVRLPGDLGSMTLVRDEVGRLVERRDSDGRIDSLAYDAEGRLIRIGASTIERDRAGRIVGNDGIAVGYDVVGRIATIDHGNGRIIRYLYDVRGIMTGVVDWQGDTTRLEFDAGGLLTEVRRPNGITTTRRYDDAGRLVEIAEGEAARIVRTLDSLGRPTATTRTGYLAATITDDSLGLAVDDASQIASFEYDEIGRLLDDGRRTLQWDPSSRLLSITDTEGTTSWRYDPFGRVVERSGTDGVIRPVRSEAFSHPHPIVDRDENGTDVRYWVRTPSGHLLYAIDAATGDRSFYHYDEIGSTQLLSDDDGTITDRYAYTPYGRMAGHDGESEQRYTFVGAWGVEREDDGLYRMGARLYDASTARFVSRDPARLLDPRQMNRYRYALGNPLAYVDVDGRSESRIEHQILELANRVSDGRNGLGGLAAYFYLSRLENSGLDKLDADQQAFQRAIGRQSIVIPGSLDIGGSVPIASNAGPNTDDRTDPIDLNSLEVFGDGKIGPGTDRPPIDYGSIYLPLTPPPGATGAVDIVFDRGGAASPLNGGIIDRSMFEGLFGAMPEQPKPPTSGRESTEKLVPDSMFGIFLVPASSIKPPPPLVLDEPEEAFDPNDPEHDPIELGDGENVL